MMQWSLISDAEDSIRFADSLEGLQTLMDQIVHSNQQFDINNNIILTVNRYTA